LSNKTQVQNPPVIANVWNTIDNYDFILVTERMDRIVGRHGTLWDYLSATSGDCLKVAGSRYHFARYA
jgi:hypothetical protein